MYSAFGVEHGEISKGLLPMRGAARGAKAVDTIEHGKPTPDAHPWRSAKNDLRFLTVGPKKKKAL